MAGAAQDPVLLNQSQLSNVSITPTQPPFITSPLTATGTAGSAFSYQITANNNPTSYNATGLPSYLSVNTATGLISGTASIRGVGSVTISATNPGGPDTLTLVLTIVGPYDFWKTQNFTPAQLLNPNISGDTASASADGISNLEKYGLGLNPNMYYSSATVSPYTQLLTVSGTSYLTLTFTQNTNATDVSYSVDASSDLSTWTSINPLVPANQVSVLPNTPATGIQTITVKDTQPASMSVRRFMRLRITIL
jgi:hypothetical protein